MHRILGTLPTAQDMPNGKPMIVESHEPYGPYGAKEVGEGAIMPTIPAILNAVHDATGIRFHEPPLMPERVYMALQEHKNTNARAGKRKNRVH